MYSRGGGLSYFTLLPFLKTFLKYPKHKEAVMFFYQICRGASDDLDGNTVETDTFLEAFTPQLIISF